MLSAVLTHRSTVSWGGFFAFLYYFALYFTPPVFQQSCRTMQVCLVHFAIPRLGYFSLVPLPMAAV